MCQAVKSEMCSCGDAMTQTGKGAEPAVPWRRLALAGVFAALSEIAEFMPDTGSAALKWLPLIFAVSAIWLGGLVTYKEGWRALRRFDLNINALMSVAVTGAVLIGQYPEAAMVMVLFNIAEALEDKALEHARKAIRNLLALAPETATVLQPDGAWRELDIKAVAVGSRIRVRPGERVALDGVIVSGRSAIDQAPITGESLPVEKGSGDTVFAGTINQTGSFEFESTSGATDSTLARIIHAVEAAQNSRAPIQRFVDVFAKYYTPTVFASALLIALMPPLLAGGAWTNSIYMALVVLVIGCPCALVISTPVTLVSGMAAATRYGILVKGGAFLEQGRKLTWLALDKTGTLTHGKPCLTDCMPLGAAERGRVTALAASLAARSDHPVSKAIAESAAKDRVALLDVAGFEALPGQGVCGVIDGAKIWLGNLRTITERGFLTAALEAQITALETQGKSVVALIDKAGVQGLFAVADTLKESSVEAVKELKRLGVKTMMVTGDNEHTAKVIAEQVGVDRFRGNLLPEEKLAAVNVLRADGLVGMAGDGINDAPALAAADIGFAMASAGTDTAIETADVALMDDDLRKVPRFIRLSRSTYAILVQNIVLALGIKAAFFILTFMGKATMWMAVFADVCTSMMVVANGLRAMRK